MPISFVATGDYIQTRRVPSFDAPPFQRVAEVIRSADARITNLEITLSYNEGTRHIRRQAPADDAGPAGGFKALWVQSGWNGKQPRLDYNYDGLALTKEYLREYGVLNTGMGNNLAEVEQPAYLDTLSGRVALIAITTPMHKVQIASEQRRNCIGRPGINPIRYQKIHTISQDKLDVLKEIAHLTEVNALLEAGMKLGYVQPVPGDRCLFGTDITGMPMVFCAGEPEGLVTKPDERDMKRLENLVDDARRQADYVVVSCHCHEMKGSDMTCPPDFLPQDARRLIDAGAHAFVGHGLHVLRGIEIYRNRPIFYSLGNFIVQTETLDILPQDFYDDNKIPSELHVTQALDQSTKDGTRGWLYLRQSMESVLPRWTMEEGMLKELVLYPIELGYGKKRHQSGFPEITENRRILENIRELSKPYGTEIAIEGGVGKIRLG